MSAQSKPKFINLFPSTINFLCQFTFFANQLSLAINFLCQLINLIHCLFNLLQVLRLFVLINHQLFQPEAKQPGEDHEGAEGGVQQQAGGVGRLYSPQ